MHDKSCALRFNRQRPVFYGWVLTWLLGPTQLVTWGIVYYTFSVLLTPMRAEMGWSSAEATGAFSLGLLASGASSVIVGRWLDRRGPRGLMIGGVTIAIVLIAAWSQVRSLSALYAVWLGLGLVMPAITYDPAFWIVTRWFSGEHANERGKAMTVLTFFGGLASTAFIPISTALHTNLGWRTALLVLSVFLAAVTLGPYAAWLKGQPAANALHRLTTRLDWKHLLRDGGFWRLAVPLMLTSLAWSAISVHFVSYALSRRFDPAFVATAAALVGVMQVVGRLIFVPLGDRIAPKWLATTLCLFQSAAIVSLLTLPPTISLISYAVCFGIGHGAMTPMRVTLVVDAFGVVRYGEIAGGIKLLTTVLSALAPVAVGVAITASGNYTPVLVVVMSLSLVAAGMLTQLNR